MDLKTCEYCGTAYDARLTQCPLCGRADGGMKQPAKRPTERTRPAESKEPKKTPAQPEKPAGRRLRQEAAPVRTAKGYTGKRLAEPSADGGNVYAFPKWMMIVICAILGAAVLFGALLAFSRLGWSPLYRDAQTTDQSVQDTSDTADTTEAQPQTVQESTVQQPEENRYMNEEDQKPVETTDSEPETQSVPCTSLTLSAPTVTFEDEGRFFNITFTRNPDECTQTVTFESSDESVATVSAQGKIVAVNAGTAVITATCGEKSAQCLVTCDFAYISAEPEDGEPVVLSLSKDDLTFFHAGEQYTLSVAGAAEDTSLTYVSSDESVVSVSDSGVLTARGGGTATVTVTTADEQRMTCIVRCNFDDAASSDSAYTLSNSDVTMGFKGETFQISLRDADGNKITGLLWVSSDLSVCSVDGTGVVTAEGEGTAYISTTYNGISYQCIVRCNLA